MRHTIEGGEDWGHGHRVREADEGPLVAHLVAVVRRGEYRDAAPVVLQRIALVLHLIQHSMLNIVS